MPIADTVTFLVGRWQVVRALEDHGSGCRGSFEGIAVLSPWVATGDMAVEDGARYEETGELRFGAHRGPASRRLGYRRSGDGGATLHFADGRPFVDLDLRTGTWRAEHLCAEDRYELVTVVRSSDLVEERWRVRGPTTGYDAVTTWRRVGPQGGPAGA